MTLRSIVKPAAFALLANPVRIRRRLQALRQSDTATILNLHRVAPDDGSDYRPLDPQFFRELLRFVVQHFDVRTIAELHHPSDRPRIALSFDDGYADFYTVACPILDDFGVRVNHNFIPACIESGRAPINVVAADFVGKAPPERVRQLDVPGFDMRPRPSLGDELVLFIKNRSAAEQQALADHLLPQMEGVEPTPMMTLDQVREVARHHEIGAHSYAHASMEFESDAFLREDARKCQAYFRERVGQPVSIYAFPNGSGRPGQEQIVLEEGYDHVLMVGEAFDSGERVHNRFTFDARSRAEVVFKATGGLA